MPEDIIIPKEPRFVLSEKQRWLCNHLDALNQIEKFCPAKPSDLFKSALYLTHNDVSRATVPDWMAQAAHSLRELLYALKGIQKPQGFLSKTWHFIKQQFRIKDKSKRDRIKDLLKLYQEERRAKELAAIIFDLYNLFTQIAHHDPNLKNPRIVKKLLNRFPFPENATPSSIDEHVFKELVNLLELAWQQSIPQQIDLHAKIDSFLSQNKENASPKYLSLLIEFNPDARLYFYASAARADVSWLDWLWGNNFLDGLKTRRLEIGRNPELGYLVALSEKAPNKVVDVMLAIPVTQQSHNPEVLERFLWICRTLPATELARIIPQIYKENWIPLLGEGNQWFEYEKIFKTLYEASDFKNILLLAKSLLSIRPQADIEQKASTYRNETPFYFGDLAETKVFEFLTKLPPSMAQEIFEFSLETFAKVVVLTKTDESTAPFIKNERFPFYDVDFFTLEPGKHKFPSYREEVTELAALIRILAMRRMAAAETPEEKAAVYKQIATLPESVVTWRFRFYALTLAIESLKPQIREAIFKIFDSEDHYNFLTMGAEYEKLLVATFQYLSENDKELYVQSCISSCKPEQHGSPIFTMIWPHLKEEERAKATEAKFTPLPNYKPHPSIGEGKGGWVRPTAPITEDDFGRLTVQEIASKLRAEWTPDKLKVLRKDEDYLTPINPEGIGEALKSDFPKRPQEYIDNAKLFFDRNELFPHYTYSFFRAILEGFQKDTTDPGKVSWDNLIALLLSIKRSADEAPLEPTDGNREAFDWVAGWDSVHAALTDVLKALLHSKNGKLRIEFAKFRPQILEILSYLLCHPDPQIKDEEAETAKNKSKSPGDDEYTISDPLTTAINSVRGRAFEGLIDFIRLDWETFPAGENIHLAPDVKELCTITLEKENTRALMFLFGHHFVWLYSGDKTWATTLLPKIFPTEKEKGHLYLAAWEGYLANNLNGNIFCDEHFQELYRRGLTLTGDEDPGRKYFKDPDEGIAVHLALAYAHYDEFGLEHHLFKDFWAKADSAQQGKFISFIGSHVFRKNKAGKEFIRDNPKALAKIMALWDWLLKNLSSPEPFKKFGTWVNHEELFFTTDWLAHHLKDTLVKSGGILDWDYELSQALPLLAQHAPDETIHIAKLFYLDGVKGGNDRRHFLHWDDVCYKTLEELYAAPSTKTDATDIINALVKQGFWKLKAIIK